MNRTTKIICALLSTLTIPACAAGDLSTENFNGEDGVVLSHGPLAQAEQALSTCVDVQRGLFGTVQDAYIAELAPTYNTGSYYVLYTGLSSGEDKRSVLQFDLGFIPADSVIDSATLNISQIYKASNSTVDVHRITAAWSENTVTWNNISSSFDPALAGTINATSGSGVRSVDLTALAQGWVDGDYGNHGVLLKEPLTNKTEFRSSENTTLANRPSLRVCYTAPTCSDGIQNQGETGVDCGGPCSPCASAGVSITAPGEAYGHHGACSGFNGCGDAATCALWACNINGYSNLVSYGAQGPCTGFNNCHLFNSQGSVQYNWGNWCAVSGVSEIVCSN
ncbi:DNRLRE domain-containing protein [Chondromyces crocatus]|uniref:Carbohydrate-binding module family 96 domain-containing protein n=1 Tax=Chondromyces crocatus TaxID=52 RepID=A0A0K1E531_CHOCO|nr:DNRLRE domain-containing protein [Chondromyces crocatus]AKT35959.1 uncharacterized protein CMC5_000710 [Chondromyces crocatus]